MGTPLKTQLSVEQLRENALAWAACNPTHSFYAAYYLSVMRMRYPTKAAQLELELRLMGVKL